MHLDHFCVKIFIQAPEKINYSQTIRIFHSWIQNQKLSGTLIDVVDYSHVKKGPGIVLIGFESDYSIEEGSENNPGLLFKSKISRSQNTGHRLADAIEDTINAAREMANDSVWNGEFSFFTDRLIIQVNDRLLAQNNFATFEKNEMEIAAGLKKYLDHSDFNAEYVQSDSRQLFSFKVDLQKPLTI